MLSEAKKQAYRKMPQEERWREVEALMTFAWEFLRQFPDQEIARRLAADRKRHDEADDIVFQHLRGLR